MRYPSQHEKAAKDFTFIEDRYFLSTAPPPPTLVQRSPLQSYENKSLPSKMSQTFVPVDDEVAIRVLIDDLTTLAPIPDKAFSAQVAGEEWKLWYNRSLDAINLQPKEAFVQQKPTNKVGIRRANTNLTFYFQNTSASGIPDNLRSAIPALAEEVRKAKKLLDKGSHFDPDSLKLIFEFMKEGSMNSDNPLIVDIGKGDKFCLWTKRVRTAPSATEIRAGIEPELKYYLNIQDEKKFDECVQENKLGLEIDEEGRVTSVVTDGKTRDPDENDALLFDSEGIWNKRLTRIIKQILADKGCEPAPNTIRVHQLTVEKVPEVVLQKWGKMTKKPQKVQYMDNKFQPGAGIDCGGLTKQFHSDLTRALFDGRAGRPFKVDETGCPMVPEGSTPDKAICKLVGQFLSEICRRDLVVGRIFPDCFFALLRALAIHTKPTQERTVEIARLFAGEYQKPIVAWLGGDESQKDLAIEMMSYAGEDGLEDMTDKEQRGKALGYLHGLVDPYIAVASAIEAGFTPALKQLIKSKTAEEVSAGIQGSKLDADDLASRIKAHAFIQSKVVKDKVEFLKAHIRERLAAGDTDWVERFLFCVTGQRAVKGNTTINISQSYDTLCRTHTCSNGLDLPATHSTPPADVKDLKERFIRNLEMTMAETGFSMS